MKKLSLLALMGAMFAAPAAPTALANEAGGTGFLPVRDGRKEPGGTPDGEGG